MKKLLSLALCLVMLGMSFVGCESASTRDEENPKPVQSNTDNSYNAPKEQTTLTLLAVLDDPMDGIDAVCKKAEEKLGIKVTYEKFSGGEDGDNIVKTRLASGDMANLLVYRSGSLLKTLNPSEYFVDLSTQPLANRLDETYKQSVSVDGKLYGIPTGSTGVGGVLYNKKIYEKYKLEIPHTWKDFLANCSKLKAVGVTAVLGTFGTNWTAQVPFLGDQYNIAAVEPKFATDFEAGKVKYATDENGLKSFQKIADLTPYYNSDYLATTYDSGCEMMEDDKAANWFILSSALGNIYSLYKDDVNKFGFFGIPGDNPEDHGITVWEPSSLYANKNSDKIKDIIRFFDFYISDEGLDTSASVNLPQGPYCIKGYELPDSCYDAVKQMQADYFDKGKTSLALEFQTAVKGPNCPSICQELGSGQTTAKEAAAKYDQDCEKQAKQLGLNW